MSDYEEIWETFSLGQTLAGCEPTQTIRMAARLGSTATLISPKFNPHKLLLINLH